MKYLLLLSLFWTQICLAQKSKVVNYVVKINDSSDMSKDTKTYYITLKEIKRFSGQSRLMELSVDAYEIQTKNSLRSRAFFSGAVDQSKNFVTSTAAISDIYPLMKPLQFTVNKGLVIVDTAVWENDIKQQINAWQINDDLKKVFQRQYFCTYRI